VASLEEADGVATQHSIEADIPGRRSPPAGVASISRLPVMVTPFGKLEPYKLEWALEV
jgi:hypothetical protein